MKQRKRQAMIVAASCLLLAGIAFGALAGLKLSEKEPPLPQGIPLDVPVSVSDELTKANAGNSNGSLLAVASPQLTGDGRVPATNVLPLLIVPYDSNLTLTVEFTDFSATLGQAEAANATLNVTAPYHFTFFGQTMGGRLPSAAEYLGLGNNTQDQGVTPWLTVPLQVSKNYSHQWVLATAGMNVRYYTVQHLPPLLAVGHPRAFEEHTQHLVRQIAFLVVSPQEYQMLEKHNEWAFIPFGFGLPTGDRSSVILAYAVISLSGILAAAAIMLRLKTRKPS